MAQACLSPSPYISLLNAAAAKPTGPCAFLQLPSSSSPSRTCSGLASPSFKNGSSLVIWTAGRKRNMQTNGRSVSVRCEQGAKQSSGLDIWLGRLAMVGFATAITIEVATGKGLLENFGFVTPIPTLALVVTAIVGILTAFFIFQSASQD